MRKVKLMSLLSSLESGGRPKGGVSIYNNGIPSLGAEHLNDFGEFNLKSVKYVPEEFYNSLRSGKIIKDDILIVKDGATTGKVSLVLPDFPFKKSSINEHLFLVRVDKKKAFPEYIFHYLRSEQGQKEILNDFRGATVGGISRQFAEMVSVPLPSFEDQMQIANLLSIAEKLIKQRKQSIELLEMLLKSRFSSLIGNPVTNSHKHKTDKLKKFIVFLTSGGRGWNQYYSKTGGRFIRSFDVQMNYISNEEIIYVDPPQNQEAVRTSIQPNDILLTITGSKIGRVSLVPVNFGVAYVSQHVAIIRVQNINPIYLSYYLSDENCGQYLIKKNQYGQSKPGLNFKQIESFEIIVPPKAIQDNFAKLVKQIDSLKDYYHKSLMELENLFGTLTQKAFNGSLEFTNTTTLTEIKNVETPILPTVIDLPITRPEKAIDPTPIPEDISTFIQNSFQDNYFTFEDLKGQIIKAGKKYDFETLTNSIFELLRNKKLKQIFADAAFKSTLTERDHSFNNVTDLIEQIYLQKTNS